MMEKHRIAIKQQLLDILRDATDIGGEFYYEVDGDAENTITFVHPDEGGLQVEIDDADLTPHRFKVSIALEPI
jgi:hypothetical protein